MPLMGEDFKFEIETATPTVYVEVKDMTAFDDSAARPESRFKTFDRTSPIVVLGDEDLPLTLGGFHTPADAGQLRMLALRASGVTALCRATFDGTATGGYTIPVKVRSRRRGATPEGLQTIAFEMVGDGAVTNLGTFIAG